MACFPITDQSEITTPPQNTTEQEGNNVTLSCTVDGNPKPSISWIKDVSPVSTSGNPRISFGTDNKQLIITNVNRSDHGEYQCVASNSLGNATSSAATLNVQCKYSG